MTVIGKTKAVRDLEQLETEINTEAFEAFYHIGQKLLRIKTERLYESAGFKSWSQYCASGRIEYKKSRADDAIRCSEIRKILPGIPGNDWSVDQVLALCKCETDNDAKRVAKKAIAIAEKSGERVTARLIAEIRDGAEETGRAVEKLDKRLSSASLESHLDKLADILVDWRKSLEQVASEQWDEVPVRILTRVRREAESLTSFLKG
jgi:DNA-binding ferritin-like protein